MTIKKNHPYVFLLSVALLSAVWSGCEKKDKLTNNTYQFVVTPPAATVLNGQTKTLTAEARSESGNIPVEPTWEISPSTAGTLNTTLGSRVVFTPSGLGDATVTATYNGQMAQSNIAVVSYIGTSSNYDVYTDVLQTGTDIFEDPSNLGRIAQVSSGYTPEGISFQRITSSPANYFWGVSVDGGGSVDLSAYNGGSLVFLLKMPAGLGSASLRVDLKDTSATRQYVLSNGSNGFSSTSQDWQQITIPLSSFSGLVTSSVQNTFSLVTLNANLSYDIDAVRWTN